MELDLDLNTTSARLWGCQYYMHVGLGQAGVLFSQVEFVWRLVFGPVSYSSISTGLRWDFLPWKVEVQKAQNRVEHSALSVSRAERLDCDFVAA